MKIVIRNFFALFCVLAVASPAYANTIGVNINGELQNFTEVLSLTVTADPVRKPSGRTLISGFSYWIHHSKFGSSGLEPDPISSFRSNTEFQADYDTVLFKQGYDTGLTTADGVTFTSNSVRDMDIRLRDATGDDLLTVSSSAANTTLINGNQGGLFQYTLGDQGGSYVESLFTITGGSLASGLSTQMLFAIITADAMHGRSSRDLYFSGMDITFFAKGLGEPPVEPPAEVPEPMTLTLLMSGMLGAGVCRKRAKKM